MSEANLNVDKRILKCQPFLHWVYITNNKIIAFIFFYVSAMIVYRVFRHENKFLVKLVHFGLQLLAFAIAIWGLKAVFDFHNHNNIPNLYSLHSWCGLTTVILFGFQVSQSNLKFLFQENSHIPWG